MTEATLIFGTVFSKKIAPLLLKNRLLLNKED